MEGFIVTTMLFGIAAVEWFFVATGRECVFQRIKNMGDNMNIPAAFSEYITDLTLKPIPFMECKVPKFQITQEEALSDMELVCYIINTAYSGKEYWEKQDIVFSELYKAIKTEIMKSEFLHIHSFFGLLCGIFNNVHDGHLSLVSPGQHKNFYKTYRAYFADVLLEKHDDVYIVKRSKTDIIKEGDIIENVTNDKIFFPTLSPTGCRHFLLGTRSWTPVETLEVRVNHDLTAVPLHPCKSSKPNNSGIYQLASTEPHTVVKSSRFWEETGDVYEEKVREIEELGKSLRGKPYVIWDIHDNGGGHSSYPEAFIRGLNDNAKWHVDMAFLSSPAIAQAQGKTENLPTERTWTLYEAERQSDTASTYNGNLYVLIGTQVGSSGEAAVSMTANVENCVLIGSNTGGIGTFGDVLSYVLPMSGIIMCLPYKLFLGGPKEGEGYAPDYWVDAEDLLAEMLRWLENSDTYCAL